jgi:hypothetical protein
MEGAFGVIGTDSPFDITFVYFCDSRKPEFLSGRIVPFWGSLDIMNIYRELLYDRGQAFPRDKNDSTKRGSSVVIT